MTASKHDPGQQCFQHFHTKQDYKAWPEASWIQSLFKVV